MPALLLAGALLLGGGGSPNPAAEIALQLLAVALGIVWLWARPAGTPAIPARGMLIAITALVAGIPLLQLVPLPPAIWTALPGREAEQAALALVGASDDWRSLSMAPPRTLASLLSLGPPLLMLWMAASLGEAGRRRLLAVLAATGLAAAVLGVIQLSAGPMAPRFYAASHTIGITGFHASRNAAADVFLIALVALAALAAPGSSEPRPRGIFLARGAWLLGLSVVLLLAVVFTASRMGIALLVPSLAAQWLLLRRALPGRWLRNLPAIGAGAIGLALGLLATLGNNAALRGVAQRFDVASDARLDLWTDAWFAAGQYWPFGSGMGTFVPVFIAAERLEALDPTAPNRAHNDFLELAIEAGAFGLAALAAIAILLAIMGVRACRAPSANRTQATFALATLVILALHSVVDYPMRSMALAVTAAMAAGLLVAATGTAGQGGNGVPRPRGEL